MVMHDDDEQTNYIEPMIIDEQQHNGNERGRGYEAQPNIHHVPRMRRERIRYNSARDFHERMGAQDCQLPRMKTCRHCKAQLFSRETISLCCMKGSIVLSLIPSPPEMVRLFSDQTDESKRFRHNIRAYNNVFAFTSMGVHLDHTINTLGRGPYTFRAQGSIYHKIGDLIPDDGRRPRYLQAYIYDTEHELENRLSESEVLDRGTVEKIQQILNHCNPFVQSFRSLGQCNDLPNCRLIIREQPADRRQYSLPTASQVAAIIVGGDNINPNGRDFIVQAKSGQLRNVKDSVGYYDPMQYPLLLPYGTYGWDINLRGNNGKKMTCCDYYAYMLQVGYLSTLCF